MPKNHWLLKSEPSTYSFQDLVRDRKTNWNGVRNFQARTYLKQVQRGDLAIIYHSGDERAPVGVSRVVRGAYPDPDPKKPGEWVQIDIEPGQPFPQPVPLTAMKTTPALQTLPLLKQSRLSVMPITAAHFEAILELSKKVLPQIPRRR